MVKNLDTKEIWKFSKSFVKREGILLLACVLAVASSLAVVPKAEYIDWRVLVLLYCLMLVVGGFKKRRVLDNCAVRLLQRCISLRQITAALLLITFISSMLVTNDVALITFVPLTLIIGKEAGVDVGKIIVWQTLAANLGSMLTPIGNPQNLYLYGLMDCSIPEFMGILLPYTVMTFVLLLLSLLCIRGKGQEISCRMEEGTEIKQSRKHRNLIYGLLFLLALLVVARILPYGVLVTAVFLYTIIFDREALKGADYALLVTFVSFFILIGNLGRISLIREALERFVSGREILTGVLASQVISNVPAAVLLSGFTENYRDLLVGVNLGGLGTLIASMASLISFKLYTKCYKENRGRYLRWFTLVNIIYLFLLLTAALYLYR